MSDRPGDGPPQPEEPTQPMQPPQPGPYGGGPGSYGAPPGAPTCPGQPPVAYAPDHPQATTALVLGILAVVLCQLLGPFAWSTGRRAVAEIDASRGQLGGRGAAQAGYVMGIVATALLALSLLLVVAVLGLGGLATL